MLFDQAEHPIALFEHHALAELRVTLLEQDVQLLEERLGKPHPPHGAVGYFARKPAMNASDSARASSIV